MRRTTRPGENYVKDCVGTHFRHAIRRQHAVVLPTSGACRMSIPNRHAGSRSNLRRYKAAESRDVALDFVGMSRVDGRTACMRSVQVPVESPGDEWSLICCPRAQLVVGVSCRRVQFTGSGLVYDCVCMSLECWGIEEVLN